MATEREVLYEKLYTFYQKYDPARLNHGIDAVVDFGLAEGLAALNAGLVDRYGDCLDSSGTEHAFSESERQMIRSRIEMFYLKHDPQKLDSQSDMDAIVEWAIYHGVDALSEKLARKYQEGIEDVVESDVLVQLEAFYAKHDPNKSHEDIRTVLTWGIVHGFTLLNQKMIEKYGEGLGSTDRSKLRKEIEDKLTAFYKVNDPSKLDPENLEFIVDYALKHGLHNLNTRLQAKYGCNMNTITKSPPRPPPPPGEKPKRPSSTGGSLRRSMRKSLANLSLRKSEPLSPAEEAEAAVRADVEYQDYLRKLIEVFYARHDPNRLFEEGVSPIIAFAISQGEEALNAKLRKKYNEDLVVIDKEFQGIRDKLVRFYERYDPTKLLPQREKDLDTIVGWALVHGVDRLNATLMRKYDEDLDGNGLRARLKLFYEANDKARKSEKEIDEIVAWVQENSVEQLNKKLRKKYGKSLEDTTFADLPPPPPPLDEDGPPKLSPTKVIKGRKKAPLPPTPPPPLPDGDLPDESQRHSTQLSLESRLEKFYHKKDPAKRTPRQIQADVKEILSNGIEAFNAKLMRQYGESLNSVRSGSTSTKGGAPVRQSMRQQVVDKV